MAFKHKNFNVIAYANGFTLWHYSSNEETLEEIEQDNYFGIAYTLMNNGDIIIVAGKTGTGIRQVELNENKVNLKRLK
jgi:hypothetical protein